MHGPTFLLFYVGLSTLSYLIIRAIPNLFENEKINKLPDNSEEAYFHAYQLGGTIEVLKLASWSLTHKNKTSFKASNSRKSSKFKKHEESDNNGLCNIETEILSWIKNEESDLKSFIFSKSIQSKIDKYYFNNKVVSNRSWPDNIFHKIIAIRVIIIICVLAIGLGKLFYAISSGHNNVLFLAALIITNTIIFIRTKTSRIKPSYKKYVSKLSENSSNSIDSFENNDMIALVSIVGIGLLQNSHYDDYYDYMNETTAGATIGTGCSTCNSSGWSDSSCSSSSCGSSCGGGCGGCS